MDIKDMFFMHTPDPPSPMRAPGILNKKEDGSFEYQIINEWQLCPKCNGNGDTYSNMENNELIKCDLCKGTMIISKVNGLPPR